MFRLETDANKMFPKKNKNGGTPRAAAAARRFYSLAVIQDERNEAKIRRRKFSMHTGFFANRLFSRRLLNVSSLRRGLYEI